MKITREQMEQRIATVAEVHQDGITLEVPSGRRGETFFHSCRPHGFQKLKPGSYYKVSCIPTMANQFLSAFVIPLYPCTESGDVISGKLTEEEAAAAAPFTVVEKSANGIRFVWDDPWKQRQIAKWMKPTNWELLTVGEQVPGYMGTNGVFHLNPIR